jgi:hypothetical protein
MPCSSVRSFTMLDLLGCNVMYYRKKTGFFVVLKENFLLDLLGCNIMYFWKKL